MKPHGWTDMNCSARYDNVLGGKCKKGGNLYFFHLWPHGRPVDLFVWGENFNPRGLTEVWKEEAVVTLWSKQDSDSCRDAWMIDVIFTLYHQPSSKHGQQHVRCMASQTQGKAPGSVSRGSFPQRTLTTQTRRAWVERVTHVTFTCGFWNDVGAFNVMRYSWGGKKTYLADLSSKVKMREIWR